MEEPNSDDDCDLLAAFDAFEKQRASAVDYQCMAVIKPTGMSWHKGSRCMLVSNLDQNGYCVHHGHRHGCSDETKWRAPGPTPEYRPRPSVEESDAVYVLNGQKRIRAAVAKAQKCDVIRSRVAALLPQQSPSEATRSILFDEMAKDLLGAPSKARAAHYQPLANALAAAWLPAVEAGIDVYTDTFANKWHGVIPWLTRHSAKVAMVKAKTQVRIAIRHVRTPCMHEWFAVRQ